MDNQLSKPQITGIKNHYIITKQRSGSTLLCFILAGGEGTHVIHEENIWYKFNVKYGNKIFNSKKIIREFISDFFEYTTHHPIQYFYLSPREKIEKRLEPYLNYNLNFNEFCNLFYLFFYEIIQQKEIKRIINKDITYHVSVKRLYQRDNSSKFVFLVRDVVSNISSLVKRKVITRNPVAHALLWKKMMLDIVREIDYLPTNNYIIVKYEDLISDTEKEVKRICDFYDIPFTQHMLNHREVAKYKYDFIYQRTLEEKKVGPLPIIDNIHTESRGEINKTKINDNIFSESEINKIYTVTNSIRKKFNYAISPQDNPDKIRFSIMDVLASIKLLSLYEIFKFYHRSTIYFRKNIRKINVFKILNDRKPFNPKEL